MKLVNWMILVCAMFFCSCGDDSTLPPVEKGKTKKSPPGQGGEMDAGTATQTAIAAERNLPPGQPANRLAERDGGYFLGDDEIPFSGAVQKRHENGQLEYWASYADGQPDGTHYFWDVDGQKLQEAVFSAGTLDGAQTFWWPDGTKKEERVWVQGQRMELRRWNKEGDLIEETEQF